MWVLRMIMVDILGPTRFSDVSPNKTKLPQTAALQQGIERSAR